MKRVRLFAILTLAAYALLVADASLHLHNTKDLACKLCQVSQDSLAGIVVVLADPETINFGTWTAQPVSHPDSRPPLHAPQRAPPIA